MVSIDVRFVSETFCQSPFDSGGDVKLIVGPMPVAVSVADKPMPDGKEIIAVRDHGVGRVVDLVQYALCGTKAEYADGWRKAERPVTLPEVRIQMELVPVAERLVQVDGSRFAVRARQCST